MSLDPVTAGIDLVTAAVNRIWPDATETQRQKIALVAAEMKAQTDINVIEAANPNIFVSGARPFIMWICGVALLYSALFEPLMRFVAQIGFGYVGEFPAIDTNLTMQLLLGILGLGGYRTFEKVKGVAR